jgi:hypothetical protein
MSAGMAPTRRALEPDIVPPAAACSIDSVDAPAPRCHARHDASSLARHARVIPRRFAPFHAVDPDTLGT